MRAIHTTHWCTAVGLLLAEAVAWAQGHPAPDAVSKMAIAEGLEVRLVAAEPDIRQPILVKMDDRGRLWTIQYLQYPNPAGLTRVRVDRWSRTVYDRVPLPPPHGPRGADRITILEDLDGDSRADQFRDFVDGLNLATGIAFGVDGVYVLQVPYLLFYPDRDHDDRPDGDPQVLLRGFGMEDAQSMANHLTWGPDGWLYGVNGSTTTCRIRGIEFQQGVWRYHPGRDKFELFCEGGGNTFGLTFDEHGELFYSTNGGPFIHALQGAYYRKSFSKHGPLHNPHTYGFFEIVQRDKVPGGPPTGGTIYLADQLPSHLRGNFIAGNFLGHGVSHWSVTPAESTFRATYQGELLEANDTWFGTTDVCLAADGSLYFCDFHDRRTAHPDPDADWDRSNGRIYQLRRSGTSRMPSFNLHEQDGHQLIELLGHANQWFADRARVHLAARGDRSLATPLMELTEQSANLNLALEATWALHAIGCLNRKRALQLLQHDSDQVRRWVIRLLCDDQRVSTSELAALATTAREDDSLLVRRQLLVSARRLPSKQARQILFPLLERGLDLGDPRIPLLSWWAIEQHALTQPEQLAAFFMSEQSWTRPHLASLRINLVRRWAAAAEQDTYDLCAQVLQAAPNSDRPALESALLAGLEQRREGNSGIGQGGLYEQFSRLKRPSDPPTFTTGPAAIQGPLADYIHEQSASDDAPLQMAHIALVAGLPGAYQRLFDRLSSAKQPDQQVRLLEILGPHCLPAEVPLLLEFAIPEVDPRVHSEAISILARLNDPRIPGHLLSHYSGFSPAVRAIVRQVLLGREESARAFLRAVDTGTVLPKEVSTVELRVIALYQDRDLDQLVARHWGRIGAGTAEEKLATMRRFNNDLRNGRGDPIRGQLIFKEHCGNCHRLKGMGTQLGPDLTNENRSDRAVLLANIVDPSSVVRRDYLSSIVTTINGRIIVGLITDQNDAAITLRDAKNQLHRIPRSEIESISASPLSLMPDGLLEKLTPEQLCDLFRYLQAK